LSVSTYTPCARTQQQQQRSSTLVHQRAASRAQATCACTSSHPVVCFQVVHLLLEQLRPELLTQELDRLQVLPEARLVARVAARGRSREARGSRENTHALGLWRERRKPVPRGRSSLRAVACALGACATRGMPSTPACVLHACAAPQARVRNTFSSGKRALRRARARPPRRARAPLHQLQADLEADALQRSLGRARARAAAVVRARLQQKRLQAALRHLAPGAQPVRRHGARLQLNVRARARAPAGGARRAARAARRAARAHNPLDGTRAALRLSRAAGCASGGQLPPLLWS
jgi:hypothetical protein